jgi:hypothetical protein
MHMHAWNIETNEMTQPLSRPLSPSWLSAVGFDIAHSYKGQGWIVLIDPEAVPSAHQCQFYGLNPQHFLVVRSSRTRSVDSIIAEFHRCKTAAAIVTWQSPNHQRLSHIPLYDLKLGVKHDHLQEFMSMPATTLRVH